MTVHHAGPVMRPDRHDQGQPRPARPPTGWPARHPGSSPRHHQFPQVRSPRQVLNATAASQSSAGTSWSNRSESVSIGDLIRLTGQGSLTLARAGRQASRRQSPPGARRRERGNRRKGSAPRRRSLLSSLNSIEPGSLPSESCDPDVQDTRRPGVCLACSPAHVLDDVGQGPWHCTVRLVYGVLHGFIPPVWRGDGI